KQELTTLKTTNANLETTRAKEIKDLTTKHEALESKYSALEASQTDSVLKDKRIAELAQQNKELTAQKQNAEQKVSSL
ncbi:hypothetical protein, partial [Helicobacter heilmannii]|uniref:hypothetical protein n=1 Tax=Helicobacter heilmannii TaxID=35817 RepID=UPI0018D0FD82